MLTRIVECCRETGQHWIVESERALCDDATHVHPQFETHIHRAVVRLPDGVEITAVSFDRLDPYTRDAPPDYGVYLDAAWVPPWPHEHVEWPDFGVPADRDALAPSLERARERARRGERVEVGCLGAHGRTGTALACMAVLAGVPSEEAVAWVRANHCERAVETDEQAAFVASFVREVP